MPTIKLPFRTKTPILACGADLKAAFAVVRGDTAVLEAGFGDLADPANHERYEKALRKAARLSRCRVIACDLHPAYFSSRIAEKLHGEIPRSRLYRVQHHEAHIAGAIADHAIPGNVIGVAFDGTGFGYDGEIWGGEFLLGSAAGMVRAAHLRYMPMPGGEAAVREPWRMAGAYLYDAYGPRWTKLPIPFVRGLSLARRRGIRDMIDKDVNAPLTSSVGRLFDAVGSIALAHRAPASEAQLPRALERLAAREWADSYRFAVRRDDALVTIDAAPVIRKVVTDLRKGSPAAMVSGKFHNAVAGMVLAVCEMIRRESDVAKVVLSGGVFQNRLLSDRAHFLLGVEGFQVYRHARVPATDAGIPVGQAALVQARFLAKGRPRA